MHLLNSEWVNKKVIHGIKLLLQSASVSWTALGDDAHLYTHFLLVVVVEASWMSTVFILKNYFIQNNMSEMVWNLCPLFFLFLSTWTFRIVEFEKILTCICVVGNVQSRSEEGFFTGSHMPCLSLNRNWWKGKARHLHKKWARNLRYCETLSRQT